MYVKFATKENSEIYCMNDEIVGCFHASPFYSGISAVAQILLRINGFVTNLRRAYEMRPDLTLLAALLDLNAQLHADPEDIDVNPLIQLHGLSDEPVDVGEYLSSVFTTLRSAFSKENPFAETFGKEMAVLNVGRGDTVYGAFVKRIPPAPVVFFAGQSLDVDLTVMDKHNLFAVVCGTNAGYCVYFKDLYGWIMISDEEICECSNFCNTNVCLAAYTSDELSVVTHRPRRETQEQQVPNERHKVIEPVPVKSLNREPETQYTLILMSFDATTMKMDRTETSYVSEGECLAAINEIIRNYNDPASFKVFYQVDDGKLTKVKPTRIKTTVSMYIEVTKQASLIPQFIACKYTDLEFTCWQAEQLTVSAVFEMGQTAKSVVNFCKFLVGDVLRVDTSRLKVFACTSEEVVEIYDFSFMTVEQIKNSESSILFSINGDRPRFGTSYI